jgi:hypothetical protein
MYIFQNTFIIPQGGHSERLFPAVFSFYGRKIVEKYVKIGYDY